MDSVTVYKSGSPEFAACSDGRDTIDLYDISISDHPSFSVNGLLVHNCRYESAIAVFSTLTATGGPIRIIGNVKGRRNWFYQMSRKAEAGEEDHHFARITAADAVAAGVLDSKVVGQIRSTMPTEQAAQLFDAQATDDEGNPFGLEAIRKCIIPSLSEAPPYAWGWDFAKSRDWTVGMGLDEQGYLAEFHRWNNGHRPPMWPPGAEYWDGTLHLVHHHTAGLPAICDSTGLGDPLIERLEKLGPYEGKKFTQQSKQQMMTALAVAIQKQEVHFPEDGYPIVSELEAFEYTYTRNGVLYSAPEGMHDDCVVTLALALMQLQAGSSMSWALDIDEDDPDWFMREEFDKEAAVAFG